MTNTNSHFYVSSLRFVETYILCEVTGDIIVVLGNITWPSTHDNYVHFGSSTLYWQTIYGGTLYQSQSGTWLNKDVEKKSRLTDGLTRPSTLSVKGRWAPRGAWLRSMTDCKVVVSSLSCAICWPDHTAGQMTQH